EVGIAAMPIRVQSDLYQGGVHFFQIGRLQAGYRSIMTKLYKKGNNEQVDLDAVFLCQGISDGRAVAEAIVKGKEHGLWRKRYPVVAIGNQITEGNGSIP